MLTALAREPVTDFESALIAQVTGCYQSLGVAIAQTN
jgi:hypothetical protein